MNRVFPILLLVTLARCTGNLPTQGQLPTVDGSQVKNVDATSVGGTSGASITNAVTAVGAATDSNTAGTVVRRDASGAFAGSLNGNAMTSTVATWSVGKQGTDIPSNDTLNLPDVGDVFAVNGTTTVSRISARAAGAHINLIFTGALTLRHSTNLLLSGAGDFDLTAGDSFDFISTGNGTWRESARSTHWDSEIFYMNTPVGPQIPLNVLPPPVILYAQKQIDRLNEFNTATGVFTARQQGLYSVSAGFRTDSITWPQSSQCQAIVEHYNVGGGRVEAESVITLMGGMTAACYAHANATIYLAAGEKIRIAGFSTEVVSTPAASVDGSIYFVHISRVGRP